MGDIHVDVNAPADDDWESVWVGVWPELLPVGATFEVRPDDGPAAYYRVAAAHLTMFAAEHFATGATVYAVPVSIDDVAPAAPVPS